ncbi:unnamed protein product [Schistosoma margrebowiei]|uniref:Uncharacterized protein n=1 Tax=Schistosoma margrebowiei TaxID=48269 RepID=A0A183LT90_9TREM|nr:unnamed protein product [Schistosoma margrebowiei]
MSGKTSDSATESVEDFLEVNISSRLQEIETIWSDITSLVQPMSLFHDPSRTIKDVELDVQETEAKLRSISRRTFDLQTVLTKSIRGTCDLNSDMSVLELNFDVNNRVDYSTSSVYSLCCSESGFASDADQFLTCQAADQLGLSNSNFVISDLFTTKSKNRKSFSSVNDNILSQSSDCLWTSNTGN